MQSEELIPPNDLPDGGASDAVNLPSDQAPRTSIEQVFEGRLHPLTLVIGLTKSGRALIPAIPLLLFGNRWAAGMLILMALAGLLVTGARYFTFRYRIEGGELITQEGLLERRQRNIPLERVQEISIEQGVLHRLLGVVDAKIETGSGQGAEAHLSVLSRADADELRKVVFHRAAAIKAAKEGKAGMDVTSPDQPAIPAPEQIIIRRLSIKDLVWAGLTSNHLLSAFVLAGAIWNFADDLLPQNIYDTAAKLLYRQSQQLVSQGLEATVIISILGALVVGVIGIIFSVIGSIVLFYGFTFSRRDDDLQRRYGLLTQRSSSLPRRRIQVLEIEEKALRRLFKLATLRADTSGRQREDKDDNQGRDVLLPIVPNAEVERLLPHLFPDLPVGESSWRRVSRQAVRRGVISGAIFCLAAAAALFFWRGGRVALLPLALLPLVYAFCSLSYRHLGYALGGGYLRTRRGWLGRSTHIVPINKIQAVEVYQTPFDRWWGLATLTVDTAGQAFTGGGPQIANLPLGEARELATALARKAAVLRYKW